MFYLATHAEHGCFIFYYEDGHIPISSSNYGVEFPTKVLSRAYEEFQTFSGVLKRLTKYKVTIVDSDLQFYQLISRHPELSL